MQVRSIVIHLAALFSFYFSPARQTVELKDGQGIRVIGKKISILEDKEGKLSIDDVMSGTCSGQFIPSTTDVPNFNVTKSVIWCRFEVKNNSSEDQWYLEAVAGSVESMKCYIIKGNKVIEKSAGLEAAENREINNNTQMFRLPVNKDSSALVLVRFKDKAPLQANLNVGTLRDFFNRNHQMDVVNGIYYGLMLIMMFYNLFLYFSVRERAYIYYVFYIFFTCVFISFLNGYFLHFPSWALHFFANYPAIVPVFFGLFALLFSINFLDTKNNSPRYYTVFKIILVLLAINTVLSLAGFGHESINIIQVLGIIMCVFSILMGISVFRKGYKPAKFYLVAWGVYMVGLLVFIFTDFGLLPFNMVTHGSFQAGSAFEALLLSVALADKVSGLKKDKEAAQAESLRRALENEKIVLEQNIVLEQKVKERTAEIEQQKVIIEEKNKDILSSIHYARRIQRTLLASDEMLEKNLPGYFVFYQPKDIVSGDFYWAEETGDSRFLICTADCTGHGVPGAFMSLLGVSFLNEIVKEKKISRPDQVLNNLRENIIHALNPTGNEEEGRDGMDAVLCRFDFRVMKLEFACANNPLWLIRNKEVIEFRPDKFPVGKHEGEVGPFSLRTVDLKKNDMLYIFTDGYADQFGGEKGKKFKYKSLQQLLVSLSDKGVEEQKNVLGAVLEKWKGNLEQVDDILIVGIKV